MDAKILFQVLEGSFHSFLSPNSDPFNKVQAMILRVLLLNFAFVMLSFAQVARAHAGHSNGSHAQKLKHVVTVANLHLIYQGIQAEYIRDIEPIFAQKCADCHSVKVPAPWYASIPLVGWVINSDREEATYHLEISQGFPFGGHGTPDEDLEAIAEETRKNEMPPKIYRFFHPKSVMTDEERSVIKDWVERSQNSIVDLKNRKIIE